MMSTFPNDIPVRDNGQPLFRVAKKGASSAPDRYDVVPKYGFTNDTPIKWVPNTPFKAALN